MAVVPNAADAARDDATPSDVAREPIGADEAMSILEGLASASSQPGEGHPKHLRYSMESGTTSVVDGRLPHLEAKYQALIEQIPAVVFMAYLDRGVGEAYVSPQIEEALGFSQEEWLEDPVRWYRHIHPDDKVRWSAEVAEMFLSGKSLRSAYRVIARDDHVICFHCNAKMIRTPDGKPWFIHGIAVDVTDLKRTEEELQEQRNVISAILDTVGALVVVLDPQGRIVRFNAACEQTTGYSAAEVIGSYAWDLPLPEDENLFKATFDKATFEQLCSDQLSKNYESYWVTRAGSRRLISWSSTVLSDANGAPTHIIATGIDITERKRLENAILEISAREQRRIGQDLHDGLGQHLTGIAFMTKVQQQRLGEKHLPEAAAAAKIVTLVNEAIHKTRELARGLLPVVSDAHGLMSALEQHAGEVESVFGISCRFQCDDPVLVHDEGVANHLYHIAQEAVNNAIKHGHASSVLIRLSSLDGRGILQVKDDGVGMSKAPANNQGMGLHIMNYRAGRMGGTLEIQQSENHGTIITCHFPVKSAERAQRT
jgi:PAS domain S-box-containing protein